MQDGRGDVDRHTVFFTLAVHRDSMVEMLLCVKIGHPKITLCLIGKTFLDCILIVFPKIK